MKLTRNTLKELIRQSIKEIDFKSQKSFDAYNKKHKMRKSTKVNIAGKDTTAGDAEGGGAKGGKPDSISASDWNNMDADEREYHTSGQYDKDAEGDDTGKDDVPYTDDDEGAGGGGDDGWVNKPMWPDGNPYEKSPNKLSGKDQLKKDAEYQKNATDKYGDYIEKNVSSKMSDSAKKRLARDLMNKDFEIPESVIKPRKTTVKEVKKWFKTLEENRYKKTYASDARRVSWLVNNNLSEDYEAMPVSMKKKWPKAAYKRERFLAKEFVKHLRTNQLEQEKSLKESIRKIVAGLIND